MNKSFVSYLLLLFIVIWIYFIVSSKSDEVKKEKKDMSAKLERLEELEKENMQLKSQVTRREPKRVEKKDAIKEEVVVTKWEKYRKIYNWSVVEADVLDIDLDITNTIFSGSTLEIKFANNNIFLLEDIVDFYRGNEAENIEYLLDWYLINTALWEENDIFYWIDPLENVSFEWWLQKILDYGNDDWGFWQTPESESDLETTVNFLEKLLLLQYSGLKFPKETVNNTVNYIIKNNYKQLDNKNKMKLFFIFKTIMKNNYDDLWYINKTKLFFISKSLDVKDELDSKGLQEYGQKKKLYELVSLLYSSPVIKPNIDDIFSTNLEDIDIENLNLYFYIMSKYHINYSSNGKIKFGYMIWKIKNRREMVRVWKVVSSIKSFKYDLVDIEEFWELPFRLANLEGQKLYTKLILNTKKIVTE